ncbi:MAG TPA: hypothetical protein VGA44_05205 [Steroidobacteraceae bacterium]
MSSPKYEVMSLELPRVSVSDCIGAALCLLCAVTVEAVLTRYPAAPAGPGIGLGAVAAAWLYVTNGRAARSIRSAAWLADDRWRLEFADGHVLEARLGARTRMLGRSLVLEWETSERTLTRWLTPWDLGARQLRVLSAHLACAASLRAA